MNTLLSHFEDFTERIENFAHELKDKLVSRGIYRKYIFGDIAGVPRVRARSSAPETEEELCGWKTHMTPLRESLSYCFRLGFFSPIRNC
jgi:hypothetical protein